MVSGHDQLISTEVGPGRRSSKCTEGCALRPRLSLFSVQQHANAEQNITMNLIIDCLEMSYKSLFVQTSAGAKFKALLSKRANCGSAEGAGVIKCRGIMDTLSYNVTFYLFWNSTETENPFKPAGQSTAV